MNMEYDVRGTLIRYIRSCQPLHECAQLTSKTYCKKDRCCSKAPDRCLCQPGKESPNSFTLRTALSVI